jgi:hypothetical protein
MKPNQSFILLLTAMGISTQCLSAAVLTFGNTQSTTPPSPYFEEGFVVSTNTVAEGILDPAGSVFSSHYFSFQASSLAAATIQTSTLGSFNLTSMDIGIGEFASASSTNITLVGILAAGGTLSATFNGVTAVQNIVLNWNDITKVTITGSVDPGFDNIVVSAVPEPSSSFLLGLGVMSMLAHRKRRK